MNSDAASRAILRDTIGRLKKIYKKCGKDEEMQLMEKTTGDPFLDACNLFSTTIKKLIENIIERNEYLKKNGQDRIVIEQSNHINKKLRDSDEQLSYINGIVKESECILNRSIKAKKKQKKIDILLLQLNERKNQFNNCRSLLESAREMNQARFTKSEDLLGRNTDNNQKIKLDAKNAMREQLLNLKIRDPSSGIISGTSSTGEVGGRKRLEDDPETAAQMKIIAEQEQKINEGLDQLHQGVCRLHQIAIQIGSELDNHDKMIAKTEGNVETHAVQLSHLNGRLDKLVKNTNPLNLCINIVCCLLLLALIGYLLYEFGVIPKK